MASRIALAGLFSPREKRSAKAIEADILAELCSHLELATSENIESGMDPESARRSAEERFGDFEGVFGACRTEKLKDRIMLQRILLVLVLILTFAVVGQAYLTHQSQRASAMAMDAMRSELTAMTYRIEQRVDTALFLGSRERPQSEGVRPGVVSNLEAADALDQRRDRYAAQLADLIQRKTQYKPSHSQWSALQREIEVLEDRIRLLAPEIPPADASNPSQDIVTGAVPLEVERLAQQLRFETDAGIRFEAVHQLREIAVAWDGHAEPPLRRGDLVHAKDPVQPSLSFREEVNAEGNLAVPELGFVTVLGLTRGQLEARLQEELETYFVDVDLQISKEAWAFDVLLEALGDSDVFVRLAAAQALGEIGDPRARRALERAAEFDTEVAVREAAASAALTCR